MRRIPGAYLDGEKREASVGPTRKRVDLCRPGQSIVDRGGEEKATDDFNARTEEDNRGLATRGIGGSSSPYRETSEGGAHQAKQESGWSKQV